MPLYVVTFDWFDVIWCFAPIWCCFAFVFPFVSLCCFCVFITYCFCLLFCIKIMHIRLLCANKYFLLTYCSRRLAHIDRDVPRDRQKKKHSTDRYADTLLSCRATVRQTWQRIQRRNGLDYRARGTRITNLFKRHITYMSLVNCVVYATRPVMFPKVGSTSEHCRF